MPNDYQVSKQFWSAQNEYPQYGNIKKRRLCEINYLLNYIKDDTKIILDLGCGDGATLLLLRELLDLEYVYAYDTSPGLLNLLVNKWGNDIKCNLHHMVVDLSQPSHQLPYADVTLSLGMLPFIFDEKDVLNVLSKIQSSIFILRTPCTLKDMDEKINHYSTELKSDYAAIYRTVNNTITLLNQVFNIKAIDRAYPESLESKFGTKQFFFVCEKK